MILFRMALPPSSPSFEKPGPMLPTSDTLADVMRRFGDRLSLPEHRQIELYTKKKKLVFLEDGGVPDPVPGLLPILTLTALLEGTLEGTTPDLAEKAGWQKYLALPRGSTTDKLVAEVFRILRIVRTVMVHRRGHIDVKDGAIAFTGSIDRVALAVHITPIGLRLLESFVVYYLDSVRQPYGAAYVEAMLMQYFIDIVAETKRFADEDRILYQFRPSFAMNRRTRLDCDNPKVTAAGDVYEFDIGPLYADAARYPIDFFVVIDDALHIIPVEALSGGRLAKADLPRWRARTPDGVSLPAHFRIRFGRETMTPGLPMW